MSRTARLTLIIGAAVLGGAAALVLGLSLLADRVQSDQAEKEEKCCWKKGVTSASLSRKVGVRIPADATEKRAALKIGSRYDTALLTFTLPAKEAKEYLADLKPPDQEMVSNDHPKGPDHRPTAPFRRLHVPEPETLTEGLRMLSLCPDSAPLDEVGEEPPGLKRLNHCVRLFTHDFEPGATRFYIRSDIE
ncbi:hypothetical protein ACQEU8_27965 [Streptomyces sp. CA-250714]|uniref:hypothetical protein n=1 Tax=Streptomyces sp. CA-250714 TaxID=3240060 RepID=UPI003D8ACB4A